MNGDYSNYKGRLHSNPEQDLKAKAHKCVLPGGNYSDLARPPLPRGSVWRCDCGQYWKSFGAPCKWGKIAPPKDSPDYLTPLSRLRKALFGTRS